MKRDGGKGENTRDYLQERRKAPQTRSLVLRVQKVR